MDGRMPAREHVLLSNTERAALFGILTDPCSPMTRPARRPWEHIAFSGDFLWDRAAETVRRKPFNIADARYAG